MTVQLLNQNYTPVQIRAMGYGPSKFTIEQGNPYIGFSQMDVGPFVQDDWRVRPNLTVSAGLRLNHRPTSTITWTGRHASVLRGRQVTERDSRPKTVIRGGWGIFYDRFSINNVEQAYRSNLVNQYTINNPTFSYDATFSTLPSLSGVAATNAAQKYVIDRNLRAPMLMQTVIGMDRQIFSHTTVSLNVMNSRGTHELLTDDINAPIPTLDALPPGASGSVNNLLRPNPSLGDIYDYQSTGIFKQTQLMASMNSTVGKWLTLFGRFSSLPLRQPTSDTDGLACMPGQSV